MDKHNDNDVDCNVVQNGIEEIVIDVPDGEPVNLKKPDEIYYELYRAARIKAKHMRKLAVEAFLESKDIKTRYMLDDIGDSDDDSIDLEISNENV